MIQRVKHIGPMDAKIAIVRGNHLKTRINKRGYELLVQYTRTGNGIYYHTIVVEKNLGKQLPEGALVHHINYNKSDNRIHNLLICKNSFHHGEIHRQTDAFKACGNASWLRCVHCKKYDSPKTIYTDNASRYYHKNCSSKYARELRRRRNKK